jgi:hypothetical protein
VNEKLLRLAESGRCSRKAVIGCRVRVVIMVVIGILFVMFSANCLGTVFMRFEHGMHVRIKKKNKIPKQSNRATEAQPNRFVFSCSHSESVPPDPRASSGDAHLAQA